MCTPAVVYDEGAKVVEASEWVGARVYNTYEAFSSIFYNSYFTLL